MLSLVGSLMIAVAAVSLARRRRAPPDIGIADRAVRTLRLHLAARHPDVRFRGRLAGACAGLFEVDGQEVPVSLQRFLVQLEAFPDAAAMLVARLVEDLRGAALEVPEGHVFGEVATAILPQVRSLDWLTACGPRFGDSALVSRPLGADLVVCFVVDGPTAMTFVCRRHLELWGRSLDEVERLACANLRRRTGTGAVRPAADGTPLLVTRGDGYDAARLLLVDPAHADRLLVAVPERDVLWLSGTAGADLRALLEHTAAQAKRSARPVSPRVYVLENGCLRALERVG